jgi:anti-anti-sigma factor
MDSSGVRVLLRAFKAVSAKGGSFTLLSPNPTVRRIIDLLGIQAHGVVVREKNETQG